MAGVKAPTKVCRLFQLTCWPMGHKVCEIYTITNLSHVYLFKIIYLFNGFLIKRSFIIF